MGSGQVSEVRAVNSVGIGCNTGVMGQYLFHIDVLLF